MSRGQGHYEMRMRAAAIFAGHREWLSLKGDKRAGAHNV